MKGMMSFRQFMANENTKGHYDYSSLMVRLPETLSDNIISWGFDHLPNEIIFTDPEDPSFGREDDIHITVIYGLHTDSIKDVSPLFSSEKQFECTLGKIAMFTKNDKFDVLIVEVECDKLHKLNDRMQKSLQATVNHPVYVPHVTIAYLKKGTGKKYVGNEFFKGEKFDVSEIVFSAKTGSKKPIKLGVS